MKKKNQFFIVFVLLLLPTNVAAIPVGENLYVSLPPESVQCINIQLPDDAGVLSQGLIDYQLFSDAIWGDMTEQSVTTDENNSVKIPMCFSSFGREVGDCSNTYSLSIDAQSLDLSKSFSGGVCVSTLPDIDYASSPSENPIEALNNNADIFDIGFDAKIKHLNDNGTALVNLMIQSYAEVDLVLSSDTLSPATKTVSLGQNSPKTSVEYIVDKAGDYSVIARINGCKESYCKKKSSVEVRDPSKSITGFSAFLFPLSINIKDLNPVKYELIINNYGEDSQFDVELVLPQGIKSGFTSQTVTVSGKQIIEFEVLPENQSSLYQIIAKVTSDDNVKQASASLSTNELLTDAVREVETIKLDNPELSQELDKELENWYEEYKTKAYGEEIDSYTEFKQSVDSLKPKDDEISVTEPTETVQPIIQPASDPAPDYSIYIIVIVVVIVLMILVFYFKFFSNKKSQQEEFKQIDPGY